MEKNKQKQLITEIMNEDAKDGLYKKQTAVEYLEKAIDKYVAYIEGNPDAKIFTSSNLYLTVEQAKQMEKQQIMQAVYDAMGTNFDPNMGRAEQYYNETFNTEEK